MSHVSADDFAAENTTPLTFGSFWWVYLTSSKFVCYVAQEIAGMLDQEGAGLGMAQVHAEPTNHSATNNTQLGPSNACSSIGFEVRERVSRIACTISPLGWPAMTSQLRAEALCKECRMFMTLLG